MDATLETILSTFVSPNRRERLRLKGLESLDGADAFARFLDMSQSIETTSEAVIDRVLKAINVDPCGLILARWDRCDEMQVTPATLPDEGIVAFDSGRVMYVKWEVGAGLFVSPPSRLAVARALVRDLR